jgi:hypothetical protein
MDIKALLDDVAKREQCDSSEIEWYAWPQIFPTTAGPRGCGGSMCSTFQVIAFDPPTGKKQMFCGGAWRHWNGEFKARF